MIVGPLARFADAKLDKATIEHLDLFLNFVLFLGREGSSFRVDRGEAAARQHFFFQADIFCTHTPLKFTLPKNTPMEPVSVLG